MKDNLQLGGETEAGEREELPWAQKLHHNVVFISARVEEPQVPAGDDAVQTSKHTLHQPGEDGVELLKEPKRASRRGLTTGRRHSTLKSTLQRPLLHRPSPARRPGQIVNTGTVQARETVEAAPLLTAQSLLSLNIS